ncbi:MAG TPA: BioY family transporter [Syntrophomonas sp.]|nr:BioY family transporter [Syntrophomonas sp.]
MSSSASSSLRSMVYASMFGAMTAIGAFIVIPLQPVPFTLQTFFTALAGTLLGGYAGALSQVVYVLLGSIGLPVFAGGKAGLGVLFGPTGGYLIGFIAGAYVIGRIMEARKDAGLFYTAMAILAGDLVIYTVGTVQLSLVAHLPPLKAILVGVAPFAAAEAIKLLAAAILTVKLKNKLPLRG